MPSLDLDTILSIKRVLIKHWIYRKKSTKSTFVQTDNDIIALLQSSRVKCSDFISTSQIKQNRTEQDAQLSQRDRAAGCIIVFAKSRRLQELGDNIFTDIIGLPSTTVI